MSSRARLSAWDRRVYRHAQRPTAARATVLPALSDVADRSVLWLLIAAALAAKPGATRRAAVRGMAGIAVTSTITNLAVKPWVARPRPRVPRGAPRRIRRLPLSSSFPSGHAASAAAFATGVAAEVPPLAAPVGLLAGAVAWSRVTSGVHYPSDVVAGLALGSAVSLLGRRYWPARTTAAAAASPLAGAPPLADGEGLYVVINDRAHRASPHLPSRLRAVLPRAQVEVVTDPARLTATLDRAARSCRVLGVAGGDGTVRAAAGAAAAANRPLAIFPVGTFNHFATDVGITSITRTVRALRAGQAVAVDLARANQWVFLNTASLGAYPRLVAVRRRWEPRVGKWAALGISLGAALPGTQPLRLHLDGSTECAWLLFVGNCLYQPAGLAPAFRTDLHDGLLDVRLLRHRRRESPRRLSAAALSRRVYSGERFHAAAYDRLTVHIGGQAAPLALDGEVVGEVHSVVFSKSPHPLLVYRPMDRPVRTVTP